VSGAERAAAADGAEVRLKSCAMDVVELVALRERGADLQRLGAGQGWPLPGCGQVSSTASGRVLSVRPGRWLLLTTPELPGVAAQHWQSVCTGCAVAVDLSAGFGALHLAGSAVREVLSRGCRLNLAADAFATGSAAATVIAQVAVILAALPDGLLLLTPATTARHLREWLSGAARPFGLAELAGVTVEHLPGERVT
jgi:heterotetrameric sarcosine oxidase gamma subunit